MRKTTTVVLYLSLSWVISDDTQICETPRKYKKDYSKYQVISVPSNISQPIMKYLAESKGCNFFGLDKDKNVFVK